MTENKKAPQKTPRELWKKREVESTDPIVLMTNIENNDILTAKEAALFLRIGTQPLMKAVKKGEIKGKKIGGKWVFSRRWLINYIEGEEENNE